MILQLLITIYLVYIGKCAHAQFDVLHSRKTAQSLSLLVTKN